MAGLTLEEMAAILHDADGPYAQLANLLRELADVSDIDLPDMGEREQWEIDALIESARAKIVGAVEPWRRS